MISKRLLFVAREWSVPLYRRDRKAAEKEPSVTPKGVPPGIPKVGSPLDALLGWFAISGVLGYPYRF